MEPEEPASATTHGHALAFLPFVCLTDKHRVAGFDFLPLRDASGGTPESIQSAVKAASIILSGYRDRHGKQLTNCVVAASVERGWDIQRGDFPAAVWASSLLFLASWACNDYF